MIKSFSAFTHEVDDIETAVSEILAQLDLDGKNQLMKNSVGIVSCFSEFISSGVWKALCEKLPFDMIGTTTISNMECGEIGETMLTLLVLTSDDVSFATSYSDAITKEDVEPLKKLYNSAAEKLTEKPELLLSFSPLLLNFSSDFYVEAMTEISGNVPNFGTLAVDHNEDYHDSHVMINGESFKDRFAILLLSGNVNPKFYVGSISEEKIFPEKGVVTESTSNLLQRVNGKPAIDYLQSLGLTKTEDGNILGINSFPIMVDYNDGTTPVARAMFAMTPEGYAVCGGNVPVDSTLSIGSFDPEEIVDTMSRVTEKALEDKERKTMLIYSCIGRYFGQGFDPQGEMNKLKDHTDPTDVVYTAAYSGGEICPVYDAQGNTFNRNHNNTFVICAI